MGGPPEELQDGLLDTKRPKVQQDQRDLSVGLHGAGVATRKWSEQSQEGRDKGESKRRGDRHFKGQPVTGDGRKAERGGGVSRPRMERRAG